MFGNPSVVLIVSTLIVVAFIVAFIIATFVCGSKSKRVTNASDDGKTQR